MKLKAGIISLVVGFFLFFAGSVCQAQEASSFPIMDEVIGGDRERSEHLDEDLIKGPSRTAAATLRDSAAVRQAALKKDKQSDKQSATNNEDEVLNFNFLYYIIQRVKMSDIMGE